MAHYFIDVSSYQPSSYAYFLDKKRRGAKGVVIKTSEVTHTSHGDVKCEC